jgi:predicted dehydrogenase
MKIAVLGCGSIGRRHIKNLVEIGGVDLLAFDPKLEACSTIGSSLSVVTTSTLAAVWEWRPEVAVVCSPTADHVKLATQAVSEGAHVFLEKPLSHSLDGVDRLAALVDDKKLVSMVGCNMRFHPGPVSIRELLFEGAIGELIAMRLQSGSYLPRWRPTQDYRQSYSASPASGGAILDCIHEIDLALWYGGPARFEASLVSPASSLGLATDGLAEILLRHDSGATSAIHLNFVQRDYRRTCELIGTSGTLYWDFARKSVTIFGEDGNESRVIQQPPGWELNDMYVDEMTYFLRCVRDFSATHNSIRNARDTLRLALDARNAGKVF